MTVVTAEQLYREYLEGSTEAFDRILEMFREPLIFYLYRLVGDRLAAEDLAEDVFVELLIHKKRYRFNSRLKTYLFTIAHHKAVNHLKKEANRRRVDADLVLSEDSGWGTLEEHMLKKETKRRVWEAVEALKPEYRTVIHLLYFEELSVKEAAQVMRRSVKQTENLAYRAKCALRECSALREWTEKEEIL